MERSLSLARLLRAYHDAAIAGASVGVQSHASRRMLAALEGCAAEPAVAAPHTLPVCRYLDEALNHARSGPAPIGELAQALSALAPRLSWRRRNDAGRESASFYSGHANAYIAGPNRLEAGAEITLGVSLLAPHVVYPMHRHPPSEIYVVMTDGDWFREDRGWYTPGKGGVIHHPPGLTHAMRAGPAPLLAIWCLWLDSHDPTLGESEGGTPM